MSNSEFLGKGNKLHTLKRRPVMVLLDRKMGVWWAETRGRAKKQPRWIGLGGWFKMGSHGRQRPVLGCSCGGEIGVAAPYRLGVGKGRHWGGGWGLINIPLRGLYRGRGKEGP